MPIQKNKPLEQLQIVPEVKLKNLERPSITEVMLKQDPNPSKYRFICCCGHSECFAGPFTTKIKVK